jgi:hypothetical protein
MRTIRAAFHGLGLKADLLKHGIGREVFICELAHNARKLLRGEAVKANYRGIQSVAEIGLQARARWLVPRSERRPEYKEWAHDQFRALVLPLRQRPEIAVLPNVAFVARRQEQAGG